MALAPQLHGGNVELGGAWERRMRHRPAMLGRFLVHFPEPIALPIRRRCHRIVDRGAAGARATRP